MRTCSGHLRPRAIASKVGMKPLSERDENIKDTLEKL